MNVFRGSRACKELAIKTVSELLYIVVSLLQVDGPIENSVCSSGGNWIIRSSLVSNLMIVTKVFEQYKKFTNLYQKG